MDFIYYHPQIFEFLKDYPQSKWPDLIISAILHGIPSLKRSQDSSPLPLLRQQLNSMREELEKLNKSLDEPKKSKIFKTKPELSLAKPSVQIIKACISLKRTDSKPDTGFSIDSFFQYSSFKLFKLFKSFKSFKFFK